MAQDPREFIPSIIASGVFEIKHKEKIEKVGFYIVKKFE